MKSSLKSEVSCSACNRTFPSAMSLNMHWARMHKDISNRSGPFGNILDNVIQVLQNAGREMTIQEIVSTLQRQNPKGAAVKNNASYISTMVRKNPSAGIVRQSRGRYALKSQPRNNKTQVRTQVQAQHEEPVTAAIDPTIENEILRRQVTRNEEILMKMVEVLMLAIR